MSVIKEGYNSQDFYVVVYDDSDEHNPNLKPHTMFYNSKESYEQFKQDCIDFQNEFFNNLYDKYYKK